MPNLEKEKLNNTLMMSSLIPALSFIIIFFIINDSPRHLILKGYEEEAFRILDDLNGSKIEAEIRSKIIKQVKSSVVEKAQFSEIFNTKFLRTTLLLTFMWMICSTLTYGPGVISSITISRLGVASKKTNHQILVSMATMTAVNIPNAALGGILSEIPAIGRKTGMIIGYATGTFFMLLCCWIPSQFNIFLGISMGLLGIPFNIIGTYSSEIYPTKIRDMALGYMYACTRVGGIISQFIYLEMINAYIFLPYYFTAGIGLIGIVLVLFLPYETHGIPLDYDHGSQLKEKEEEGINLIDKEN